MRRLEWICLLVAFCGSAFGQTFDLDQNRVPLISIDGLWRLHAGNDMRWADPRFDDSSWALLRSDHPWTEKGFPHPEQPWQNMWYRFQISVPARDLPAAMMLPPILPDYEVYVNGRKVRSARTKNWIKLRFWAPIPEAIPLESSASGVKPHTFVVAVRVRSGGATTTGGLAGRRDLIVERVRSAQSTAMAESEDRTVSAVVSALIGALVFGLFCLRTKDREYLWFALTLLASACSVLTNILGYRFGWISIPVTDFVMSFFGGISDASALLFFRRMLGRRRTLIWWICFVAAALGTPIIGLILGVPPVSYAWANTLSVIFELPAYAWILGMLIHRAYVRDRDAQLLLVPTFANFGWTTLSTVLLALQWQGWVASQAFFEFRGLSADLGPWRVGLTALFHVIFTASLLAFLIRRFALSRQSEERLAADVEAARQVQQILLPEENPAVRGFEIESVYLPAETVSGDFFQHIPDGEGGVLVVVGDVAGKGLQAAMLVSVLVGAIRTEAGHSCDPGRILAVLNERLQGRGKNSFATCLVAHISSGGQMRIANAGHIPPYLNGGPLDLPGSLPLGVAADVEYEVHEFRLDPGDSLRFVSDGVLEAQDAAGNLLGFERTRELSREKAQLIAKAAQEFGQKDDITVSWEWLMRRLEWICLLAVFCGSAFGQTFDLDQNGVPLISIDGLWRFRPGDDMRWADPKFDDSSWTLLRSDASGQRQIVPRQGQERPIVWYRFQISTSAHGGDEAFMLPEVRPDYEVYVDGKKVRSARAKSWPSRLFWHSVPEAILLEAGASRTAPHAHTVAIRVLSSGGARAGGIAGSRELVAERVRAAKSAALADSEDETVNAVVAGLIGSLVLGLFCLRTNDREYLWFAITLLSDACNLITYNLGASFGWMSIPISDFAQRVFGDIYLAGAMLFFQTILGRRRTLIWWSFFIPAALNSLVQGLIFGVPPADYTLTGVIAAIFDLPAYCWILTMLVHRAFVGDRDAQLLLLPTLANYGWSTVQNVFTAMELGKWISVETVTKVFGLGVNVGPWRVGIEVLFDVIFVASLVAFLIRRFAMSRQREERLAADVEAARQIQQILLPEENPSVNGFQIESVYLPAETVSGDFFQHLPDGQDGLLIVAGDVAGKGLQAAMLVSVLVGAIRTEASHTSDPGRILAVLNERLQGRGKTTFATCLVAHISSGGQMQIANAGHIPPYLNGAPLDLPGSLPLGVAVDVEYEVHEFRLNPGDSLRFVSDGVVEAQDAAGNLLGFERTRELSREKAQLIAKAAQEFGQKDDITVVGVDFLGVAHAAA